MYTVLSGKIWDSSTTSSTRDMFVNPGLGRKKTEKYMQLSDVMKSVN